MSERHQDGQADSANHRADRDRPLLLRQSRTGEADEHTGHCTKGEIGSGDREERLNLAPVTPARSNHRGYQNDGGET